MSDTARPSSSPHAPQLRVILATNFVEYRLENTKVQHNGKASSAYLRWIWLDVLGAALLAYAMVRYGKNTWSIVACGCIAGLAVYRKCSAVLWESVFVFPPHGIQLETHRGLPGHPLSASRRFIPMVHLQDVIINEGLYGWTVRYYMAVMKRGNDGRITLHIAYENILPHFPILVEVYKGVRDHVYGYVAD